MGFVKSFGTPLGVARTVCGLASNISCLAGFSEKANKRVDLFNGCSETAALILDVITLRRSFWNLETMSECGLSVVKKSCDTLRWLDRFNFITLESFSLSRLEGLGLISDVMSTSLRLWQEEGPNPPMDADYISSVPKFLKASLLVYVYLTDDQRVKIVASVIGVATDGYSFYKRARSFSFDFRAINIAPSQAYKIISLIAAASLAYYVLEITYLTKALR
ncbi:MAG TPA: hypothetical protein VMR37_08135 [Rhabdochlamydiaceae bacterium]|nr:hypothetical protein [Rhabdochlamydiaceae bacterium]